MRRLARRLWSRLLRLAVLTAAAGCAGVEDVLAPTRLIDSGGCGCCERPGGRGMVPGAFGTAEPSRGRRADRQRPLPAKPTRTGPERNRMNVGAVKSVAFGAIGLGRALVLRGFRGLRDRFGDIALFSSNDARGIAGAIREATADKTRLGALGAGARARLRAARESGFGRLEKIKEMLTAGPEPAPARRVLVISEHDYPSHPLLYLNIEALVAGGARVDLTCTGDATVDSAALPSPLLRVHRVRLAHRRDSWLRYPLEYSAFFLRALPTICSWSVRNRYDVVEVDNMPDLLVFSALIARLRGARVVLCLF